jgi:hypothetical protein
MMIPQVAPTAVSADGVPLAAAVTVRGLPKVARRGWITQTGRPLGCAVTAPVGTFEVSR